VSAHLLRRAALVALALLLGTAGAAVPAAGAGSLCVNHGGTGGCYGLIADAIAAAAPGDTIHIASAASPYLERLSITKSLSLIGDDPATTIIDGGHAGQVVRIDGAVTVMLANLTVRNGLSNGGTTTNTFGGGLYNHLGTVTLNQVMVRDNNSGTGGDGFGHGGGGIFTQQGQMTINSSLVTGNTTGTGADENFGASFGDPGGEGGGIYVSGGALTINDSQISANITGHGGHGNQRGGWGGYGAGIAVLQGALTLNRSTVANNTTGAGGDGGTMQGGSGGGVWSAASDLTITASTLSGNLTGLGGTATTTPGPSGIGAGIDADNTANPVWHTVSIVNSTLSNNLTGHGLPTAAGGDGGGLYSGGPLTVTLTNDTVAFNGVDKGSSGGAIANNGSLVTVRNSLLAKNHDANGPDNWHDCAGALTSLGYNIMTEPDCTPPLVPGTEDQLYVRGVIVLALAGNGGPTQTNALPPGSLAIDAADNSACSANDQRGFPRPVFGGTALRCDVGAFELYRFAARLPLLMR